MASRPETLSAGSAADGSSESPSVSEATPSDGLAPSRKARKPAALSPLTGLVEHLEEDQQVLDCEGSAQLVQTEGGEVAEQVALLACYQLFNINSV